MRKYIDADKVIDYANQEVTAAFYYPQDGQRKQDEQAHREKWAFVKQVMIGTPAADVVEVVRCKDCIYHTEDNECANGRWDNWSNSDYGLYPEALEMDYCSYGVRKDG